MNIPDNLRYTDTHEWVRMEPDGSLVVGITDHAQAELTDIVYAEPPKPGASLRAREVAAVVESVKAASDIYAPISGEVVEANAAVASNPALLNTDPYGEGWLFKLKPSNPSELDTLLTPEQYRERIAP